MDNINIEEVIGKLDNVKSLCNTGNYTAKCPVHDDAKNSFSVFKALDGKYVLFCHAGCEFSEIKEALQLTSSSNFYKTKGIVKVYQYFSKEGLETFQCLRYFPKDFKQRQKVNGNWVWNLEGIELTLYRLPELLSSDNNRAVFITEGEEDADRLTGLGLIAVSAPLGAGKWKPQYNEFLANRICYILEDNDKAGKEGALKIAKSIYGIAKQVKIISFGELDAKGDVSNYLDSGNTLEDLKQLIKNTVNFTANLTDLPTNTKTNNQLPASVDLELVIINSCLLDNSLITKVSEMLTPADFYLPIHSKAIDIIIQLFETTNFIDKPLLMTRLNITENPDTVKSFESKLVGDIIGYYIAEVYCKAIKHKAKIRNLITSCEYLTLKAKSDINGEVFDEAEEKILSINNNVISSDGDFAALGTEVAIQINEAENYAESGGALLGISSGYADIDAVTFGFQKGDLILIAGRPSMGKTSLVMDMVNATAAHNLKVAVFTLEMSKKQIVTKLISQSLEISANKIKTGNLSVAEWGSINTYKNFISNSNIRINDKPAITTAQMRRSLRRLIKEIGNLDLIVLDYMQLMSGSGKRSENRQQEVSQISRELKQTAKMFDVPLIALSQLSRAPEARKPPRPQMSDLRESGSLEQDADIVSFVYRDDYYNKQSQVPGLTEFIIDKNRNGATTTCYLQFMAEFTHFEASTFEGGDF